MWNRCSYVKIPETGQRVARPNPPDDRVATEVPDLRIIDDDLWIRVKTRQAALRERAEAIQAPWMGSCAGAALNATHRARYLFSGLLTCGACGANYTMIDKDRYGCANRRNGRTLCTNSKTVGRQMVERRVLNGLRDGLLTEENIRVFVQEMQTEARKARETERADRTRLERELKAADASIAALIDLIEQGKAPPSVVERITERESERDRLRARLDALSTEPDVVELPPTPPRSMPARSTTSPRH